jgi:hypothetical protein
MIPLDPRGEGGSGKRLEVNAGDGRSSRSRQVYFNGEIHSERIQFVGASFGRWC